MDKERDDGKKVDNSCREVEILKREGSVTGVPAGILRVDLGKLRRASSELKYRTQIEPTSPQPSIDRLSVTFADESLKGRMEAPAKVIEISPKLAETGNVTHTVVDEENSEDEDYSASVNAIMLRRASTRRSKKHSGRRGSSPFSPDILPEMDNGRRRSSVFTTSSGDTVEVTMEDSLTPTVTQDQISENIKLHKEVLSNVKMQPWNMRKKLRLVTQAKSYIKKHEGALQERLAQSRSTKDMLARCNIYIIKKWHQWKREAANMSNWLIPWERRIKEIESHFGSVVASYFIFLRWLFWVNLVVAAILIAFVAVPEMLTVDIRKDTERKSILSEDKYNSTNFLTLWDFEGVFKYSPMFYGWYSNRDSNDKGYRLPLAYFFTGLVVYVYSFVATLRRMAKNSRMSKLSEKEDECIFTWKIFTGWDYMIGNTETAHNRVASIIMSFKEALLEEAEKKREAQSWKIIGFRVLVNLGVLSLLALSAFAVITVVARSNEKEANSTTWRRNEITVVMSLISLFFPIFFEVLGYFEHYHPRKQLRLQLARIMVLNLLNLYSLIFALFGKISDMTSHLQALKPNAADIPMDGSYPSLSPKLPISTTQMTFQPEINYTSCYSTCIGSNLTSANLIANVTKTILPDLMESLTASVNIGTGSPEDFTEMYNKFVQLVYENVSTLLENTEMQAANFTHYPILLNSSFINVLASNLIANITLPDLIIENFTDFISNNFTQAFYDNISDPYENVTPSITDYYSDLLSVNASLLMENLSATMEPSENFTAIYNKVTQLIYALFENVTENFSETPEMFSSSYADTDDTTPGMEPETIGNSHVNKEIRCRIHCDTGIQSVTTYVNETVEIKSISTDYRSRSRLRSLCWETMFGQELMKLTVMDLVMTVLSTMAIDFLRGIFVRYMNNCWCWDLEKKFPQYGDFKVAENILHLVNNQGMVWMGMFFSPGLVVLNVFKLYIMMYLRSWAVLACNVPHEVIFRASRSNNFYFALLLMMLFLCVLPVGYTVVWLEPSWHCGPFSNYRRIFHIFTKTIKGALPQSFHIILDYIASPGIVIPLLVLLILIIYYLVSLANALRESNNDLKIQLRRERTEERRKMFQIADRRRRVGSDGSGDLGAPFGKWKKLLQGLPYGKSFDETPKQESLEIVQENAPNTKKSIPNLILRAINKNKKTSKNAEESADATDTEQHDSLPDDINLTKETTQTRKTKQRPIQFENTKFSIDSGDYKFIRTTSKKEGILRKDSTSSTWSDNIPVITISKSSECILESKIKVDIENGDKVKPTIKNVIIKQESINSPTVKTISANNDDEQPDHQTKPKITKQTSQENVNEVSVKTVDTKTESSTDYKDSTFSN